MSAAPDSDKGDDPSGGDGASASTSAGSDGHLTQEEIDRQTALTLAASEALGIRDDPVVHLPDGSAASMISSSSVTAIVTDRDDEAVHSRTSGTQTWMRVMMNESAESKASKSEDQARVYQLIHAIVRRQDSLFYELCPKVISLDVRGQMGWTPLMWAVHKNRPAYVEHILFHASEDSRPRRRSRDKQKRNVLHLAVDSSCPDLSTVMHLIRYQSSSSMESREGRTRLFNINDRDKNGNTVLHLAANRGHFEILRLIYICYFVCQRPTATSTVNLSAMGEDGSTKDEKDSKDEEIKDSDDTTTVTDPSATEKAMKEEESFLTMDELSKIVCEDRFSDTLWNAMIAKHLGSTNETLDSMAKSLEHTTVSEEDLDVVPKVVDRVLSISDLSQSSAVVKDGDSGGPASSSSSSSTTKSGSGMIEEEETVGSSSMEPGYERALSRMSTITVGSMASFPDFNAASANGATPLHCAVNKGHTGAVVTLLQIGLCDVNAEDGRHRTALMIAIAEDHLDIARALLSVTPDAHNLDAKDRANFSWNVIMWAVYRRRLEGLRLLLDTGILFEWWHMSDVDETMFDMFITSKFVSIEANKLKNQLRMVIAEELIPLIVEMSEHPRFPDGIAGIILDFAYS